MPYFSFGVRRPLPTNFSRAFETNLVRIIGTRHAHAEESNRFLLSDDEEEEEPTNQEKKVKAHRTERRTGPNSFSLNPADKWAKEFF